LFLYERALQRTGKTQRAMSLHTGLGRA
jgi:hypothetical protein